MRIVDPFKPGDQVYLVPVLPTAPRVAYRMPQATVVRAPGARVVVLVDGREIETDERNIKRTRPDIGPRDPKPYPRPSMPDGYDEITLW